MARASVIQLVSSSSVSSNLNALIPYFIQAKEAQVSLIVLPENVAFMGKSDEDKGLVAESYGAGVIQETISQLAKRYGIWVIAGTIPIKTGGPRVRSSCLVYDDAGACVARYDKIHLFDVAVSAQEVYQESQDIEPGDQVVVVDTPIGRVGLSVCYDLRFPELYRRLTEQGAEVFSIPSAFTALTGAAHWETLLRARAIENLSYVLAPNQGGEHDNGRSTYGHSMIIEPWGAVIAEQAAGKGMIVAEIDLARLRELRSRFPCNEHHVLNGSE